MRRPEPERDRRLKQLPVAKFLPDLRHADVARLHQHVSQAEHAVLVMIVQFAAAHAVQAIFAMKRFVTADEAMFESPADDHRLES